MPLRDLPNDLEQAFLTLSAEAGSPATTGEYFFEQLIGVLYMQYQLPTVCEQYRESLVLVTFMIEWMLVLCSLILCAFDLF